MQETRRAILAELADGPVPGPALADRLDISRAAVWKHVEALREAGFALPSTDAGYRLETVPEYGSAAIEYGLDPPYEIDYFDSVPSTNAIARDRAEGGATDLVILADEQTGGRGRRDRGWNSPAGGVWMSIVVRPDWPPARVPLLTLGAAVAVTAAVGDRGVDAAIKWPNDVIVEGEGERGGTKLCGVLTEMTGEAGRVSWVVVGMGINANVAVEELPPGATSLQSIVGPVDRRSLVQDVLERFADLADHPEETIAAWKSRAATLGQHVRIETATESFEGSAIDVTETGALIVETAERKRTVHAGDCEHLRPV